MTDNKRATAILRTAVAILVAAAAVASCASDHPVEVVPAAAGSTATASGDEAALSSALTSSTPAPAPALAAQTTTAVESAASAPQAPTAPAAPAAPASLAGVVTSSAEASSWDYSPLPDHSNHYRVSDAGMQAPNPAVIRIPSLDVEAPIIPLGLQEDGSIEVPENPEQTGWWLGGPEPGERGPAVILGHVDSREEGPAVFFHLRYLEAGDEIHIDRVDGSTVSYAVESIESHDKDEFPTDAVYGPTEQPTLRLVTCGGDFDFDVRTYEENVIVFASLI